MKRRYGFNVGLILFMAFLALGINIVRESFDTEEVMSENKKAYIAIVIDDMGGGAEGTEEILSLPIKTTICCINIGSLLEFILFFDFFLSVMN